MQFYMVQQQQDEIDSTFFNTLPLFIGVVQPKQKTRHHRVYKNKKKAVLVDL